MRILWFTHFPSDALNRHFGRPSNSSGYWIQSLVAPLAKSGDIQLCIVTATPGMPACHFDDAGVEYYNIPQNKILETYGLWRRWRLKQYLRQCASIIEQWRPDVIHVHGTERFFGLVRARGLSRVPMVVSVQGLISQVRRYSWGAMSWRDAVANTTIWDITHNATLPADSLRFRRQAVVEREILGAADGIIGRTDWDRAHTREFNLKAPYFHVDETMRPEFRNAAPWSPESVGRGTIMTIASPAPLKGVPILLQATAALRRRGHDVRLKIAGLSPQSPRGMSRFVFKLMRRLGLDDAVELLNWVTADKLVEHMRKSSCFVSASFIENSSNAICEAQLLGMPVIATHTGGTPTLVQDGQTGLLFSRGDAATLSHQIERILQDDELARRLGHSAREEARRRHDPDQIIRSLCACYRSFAYPSDNGPGLTAHRPLVESHGTSSSIPRPVS